MQRIVLSIIAIMTMITMNSQTFESLNSPWPKGEPNPYGKYFIGQSYLADVGGGVINVTFEPGCRNNWHIHHKQVQVLICVAGKGWYQEWGIIRIFRKEQATSGVRLLVTNSTMLSQNNTQEYKHIKA